MTKKSRKIGRYVDFGDQRGVVLEELRPDSELASQYIVSRASTRATQFSAYSYISHVIIISLLLIFYQHNIQANTERYEYVSQGMYHNEGGWRPDINHTDSNQLMRWRRKIEKDDHYITQMTKTGNVSRGNSQLVLALW